MTTYATTPATAPPTMIHHDIRAPWAPASLLFNFEVRLSRVMDGYRERGGELNAGLRAGWVVENINQANGGSE